jgi:ABC-type sugar transport system ATPase subunit
VDRSAAGVILEKANIPIVFFNREPFVDDLKKWNKVYRDTEQIFKNLEMDINPRTMVRALSVSKVQSMEIAKAVSYEAKVIIMDEPTSSLTENEVEHLFKIIRDLKQRGGRLFIFLTKLRKFCKFPMKLP